MSAIGAWPTLADWDEELLLARSGHFFAMFIAALLITFPPIMVFAGE